MQSGEYTDFVENAQTLAGLYVGSAPLAILLSEFAVLSDSIPPDPT